MSKQYLRDPRGALLGTIETTSDGRQELRDSTGSLKGSYEPKSNQTRDSRGAVIGTGNILSSLL